MQVCATLPGEREVGAPLLKCIDVHPLCSIAPHPLAATLMKLCVMIRLCYLELPDLSYWEF
jgi:hypothetical protein